ncbi:MAG: carbohydrate binding domain-containing protein [Kiritimatiellales bacterium]|nr:carbohydrate binding domain-containing protein [Kiritimatiellales bacterium]
MKGEIAHVAAVFFFSATGIFGGELLTNPDFESGTDGWFGNSCSIAPETTHSYSGSGAVYVYDRSQNWHSVRQDITAVLTAAGPGSYTMKAYALDAGGGSPAKLKVRLRYGGNTYYMGPIVDINSNNWTELSALRTLSWTGTLELAEFYVANNDSNAAYYVDGCSLWIDDPPTNSNPTAANDIPYEESLETYGSGTRLLNTNGWSSGEWDAPTVVPNSYVYTGARPTAVTHEQVLDLGGTMTNFFQCSQTHTNILLDTMMQPSLRIAAGYPVVSPDAHASFYFNSNGVLTVHHAVYSSNFTTVSNHWTELNHAPITDGQWVRMTAKIDYLSDSLRDDKYFTIALNGQPELTHALAYNTLSPTSEGSDMNGKWFLCPNSGLGGGSDAFSGFIVDGVARLDDVVISDPLRKTSRGTSHAWIDSYYATGDYEGMDMADTDGDGMLTWEEFAAGTDPTRADSMFGCASVAKVDGSFEVKWLGSPDGAHTPYWMYRSTNLLDSAGGWKLIDAAIPRDYSGTNVWTDPSPPVSPSVFYRPAASSE